MKKKNGANIFCIITGQPFADSHHLITRAAGGSDDTSNIMALRHDLHNALHTLGLSEFTKRYPAAKEWLLKRSWTLEQGRWIAPPEARRPLKG